MSRRKVLVAVSVVLAIVCFMPASSAAQQKRVGQLTAEDHIEIHELLAQFNGTLNVGDAEGFASLFLPDGTFNLLLDPSSPRHIEGRDALVKFVQDYKLPLVQVRIFLNLIVEPTPDGAIATSDQFAWFMDKNAFINAGGYNDVLVKTREGWRFKSRTLYQGPAKPGSFGRCEKCDKPHP